MGILAEQEQPEVQENVANEEETQTRVPPKPSDISRDESAESVEETPVDLIFEPSQVVETKNKTANGNLVNKGDDSISISITPKVDKEVYSFDIFDENMKLVYTINATSGRFESKVMLPKGNYTYFIKTQRDDMPFSVIFGFEQ